MRPRARVTSALTVVVALLAGCSGGAADDPSGAGDAACPSPASAPAAQRALLPPGLDLTRVGTLTRVTRQGGHTLATLVSSVPLVESTVAMQDALVAAGYRPAGMDNEGFEAEVFFTSGSYAAGQALFRESACPGRWDVELVVIDPDRIPSPSS